MVDHLFYRRYILNCHLKRIYTRKYTPPVDITKTGKGFYEPTDPNNVEILLTRPAKTFVELGTLTVQGFSPSDTAIMHNAIRTKAAPLGANAVILTNQGILQGGFTREMWATGVAIRYSETQ